MGSKIRPNFDCYSFLPGSYPWGSDKEECMKLCQMGNPWQGPCIGKPGLCTYTPTMKFCKNVAGPYDWVCYWFFEASGCSTSPPKNMVANHAYMPAHTVAYNYFGYPPDLAFMDVDYDDNFDACVRLSSPALKSRCSFKLDLSQFAP